MYFFIKLCYTLPGCIKLSHPLTNRTVNMLPLPFQLVPLKLFCSLFVVIRIYSFLLFSPHIY